MTNGSEARVVVSVSIDLKHYNAMEKLVQSGKARNKSEAIRKIFDYWCDRHAA